MKTTYLRVNFKKHPSFFTFAGIVLLGIIVLFSSSVRGFVSGVVYTGAPFVWETGDSIGQTFQSFFAEFRSKQLLELENESLTSQVERMKVEVSDRDLLVQKIADLQSVEGIKSSQKRVLANVIDGPGESPYDTLLIDEGENAGIKTGDTVSYAGAGVIGEIAEVYSSSAKIELFSSPGKETASLIGANKVPALSEGIGMGNFEATIPEGSAVSVGDQVFLPGGELILGTVGSIEEKQGEPFAHVLSRTAFNISDISEVEVLVK